MIHQANVPWWCIPHRKRMIHTNVDWRWVWGSSVLQEVSSWGRLSAYRPLRDLKFHTGIRDWL